MFDMVSSVAIVGAGISGLSLARELKIRRYQITLFDKGRSMGGRLANRRVQLNGEDYLFEHGMTLLPKQFKNYEIIRHCIQNGTFVDFKGQVAYMQNDHLVLMDSSDDLTSAHKMTDVLKVFYDPSMTLHTEVQINQLIHKDGKWYVASMLDLLPQAEQKHQEDLIYGPFDSVFISIPPKQQAPLLFNTHPEYAKFVLSIKANPMWVGMLIFDQKIDLPFDHCRFENSNLPFRMMIRENAKPNRSFSKDTWTIQMNFDWSCQNLEKTQDLAILEILEAFKAYYEQITHKPFQAQALYAQAHRWRYAHFDEHEEYPHFRYDPDLKLGICGDFLSGSHFIDIVISSALLAQEV